MFGRKPKTPEAPTQVQQTPYSGIMAELALGRVEVDFVPLAACEGSNFDEKFQAFMDQFKAEDGE